jgi:ABC-type Mn2+/Zn2+ transport system ATPase subunit
VVVPAERHPSPEGVHLDGATVRYGRHEVLRELTLAIDHGEYVCVRGANGAGKTTLLRLIAGAIRPTRGSRRGPRSCAYVPPALAPPAISVSGWVRGVRRERVDDPFVALSRLGFDGDAERSCRALSFGNLRKVLLADAFTAASPLLAIDEAHVGLDHAGRVGLERLVADARARGASVLVAAQDDDTVAGTDRTLVVGDGHVREHAPNRTDLVELRMRGPRAAAAELLEAAERLGFRPDVGGPR